MNEPEITKETFPHVKAATAHPILATFPAHLKDPKNYKAIQKAILEAGATKHSHGEVMDWAGCKTCQGKQRDRLMMMKKLGFASAAHYMTWQKIHRTITERVKLR